MEYSGGSPAKAGKEKDVSGRLSPVTSALLLLKEYSGTEGELGISNLAKRLGLAKSTVHRLVVTLAAEGFLEQNPDSGRYRLGVALFELGTMVRRRMDVSTLGKRKRRPARRSASTRTASCWPCSISMMGTT